MRIEEDRDQFDEWQLNFASNLLREIRDALQGAALPDEQVQN